jgi:hypothetical protein
VREWLIEFLYALTISRRRVPWRVMPAASVGEVARILLASWTRVGKRWVTRVVQSEFSGSLCEYLTVATMCQRLASSLRATQPSRHSRAACSPGAAFRCLISRNRSIDAYLKQENTSTVALSPASICPSPPPSNTTISSISPGQLSG